MIRLRGRKLSNAYGIGWVRQETVVSSWNFFDTKKITFRAPLEDFQGASNQERLYCMGYEVDLEGCTKGDTRRRVRV